MATKKTTTKPAAAAPKATPRRTTIFLANLHTAAIIIPRKGRPGLQLPPLTLASGQATPVPAEEWEMLKRDSGIQNYLDTGLIKVVRKEGTVGVSADTSSNPVVPPHLQRDDEAAQGGVKATARRRSPYIIGVD